MNSDSTPATYRFLTCFSFFTALLAVLMASLPGLSKAAMMHNEAVVYVFESPVFTADLAYDAQGAGPAEYLRSQILSPVLSQYRKTYKSILSPLDYEIKAARYHLQRAYLEQMIDNMIDNSQKTSSSTAEPRSETLAMELLSLPSAQLAEAVVSHWKFQKHLYDFYGGGRVAMHAYGPEAIDATVKWLSIREIQGDFRFRDRELRAQFYSDWSEVQITHQELSQSAEVGRAEQSIEHSLEHNRKQLLSPQWLEPILPQ